MSDSSGTQKSDGLGDDGTIPPAEDGVAAGVSEHDSNFEPEEDAGGDDLDSDLDDES